ncbi:MAG TPA: DUF4268 domain-containing protein [Caulobacterales bacterium]|nr:DUF4268 domain-containing protein [Caulobacterales bacterium]
MAKSTSQLGHLTKVDPRLAWQHEAGDFTPWLAQEENFQILADALHLSDAVVEAVEKSVGDFSADIIARDRDGTVLVENQLGQTDHTHLGQIMTYLAGLEGAVKVVWISTKIRDEHRAAVDWLNANTSDDYSFFAVELEVYRIGDSPAAPYFYVAARPNDWSRHAKARTREIAEGAATERQQRYISFWSAIAKELAKHEPAYSSAQPPKDHWWSIGIGRTNFSLTIIAGMRDQWIGAEVFLHKDEDKVIFDFFKAQQEAIEAEFGGALDWERLDGQKGSRTAVRMRNVDPSDANRWPEYAAWYGSRIVKLRQCFAKRIRDLDIEALRQASGADQL